MNTENELELAIQDIGDSIHDALALDFDRKMEEAQVYEYGGVLVPEEVEARIREDFEESNTVSEVFNLLKDDSDFKRALSRLVKYIVCHREV